MVETALSETALGKGLLVTYFRTYTYMNAERLCNRKAFFM
jgi:NADH:ubiquinone oxidoreductase subunit K